MVSASRQLKRRIALGNEISAPAISAGSLLNVISAAAPIRFRELFAPLGFFAARRAGEQWLQRARVCPDAKRVRLAPLPADGPDSPARGSGRHARSKEAPARASSRSASFTASSMVWENNSCAAAARSSLSCMAAWSRIFSASARASSIIFLRSAASCARCSSIAFWRSASIPARCA